jgi:hypothetical protein
MNKVALLKKLASLANDLDRKGHIKEANEVDAIINLAAKSKLMHYVVTCEFDDGENDPGYINPKKEEINVVADSLQEAFMAALEKYPNVSSMSAHLVEA